MRNRKQSITSQPQTKPSQTNPARWFLFDFCYIAFMIAYCILFLYWIVMTNYSINDIKDSQAYNQSMILIQTWKLPFIEDISVSDTECQEGYIPIINYNWPGTIAGCSCSYHPQYPDLKYVLTRNCTSKLKQEFNCKDVDEMNTLILSNWREKRICQKLSQNSYYNEFNCTQGKKCGGGQSAVCVNPSQQCSVNYFNITNTETIYKDLKLDGNKQLVYGTSKEELQPIIQFKVSEFELCDSGQNISPGKVDYTLMKEKRIQCDKGSLWQKLDEISEKYFYESNLRQQVQIVNLPGYPLPSQFLKYQLGYRRYPLWNYECRVIEKYSIRRIDHELDTEDIEFDWQQLAITNCIGVFIVFVLTSVLLCSDIGQLRRSRVIPSQQRPTDHFQMNKPSPLSYRISLPLQVMIKMIKILQFPSIVIASLTLINKVDWFIALNKKQCSNEVNFEELQDYYETLNSYYITMTYFWIASFSFDTIVMSIQCVYGFQQKQRFFIKSKTQ